MDNRTGAEGDKSGYRSKREPKIKRQIKFVMREWMTEKGRYFSGDAGKG
jgi:hypothetical protein